MIPVRHNQAMPRMLVRDDADLFYRYDPWIIIAAVSLLALGLTMVASASVSTADRELGQPLYYFWRQSLFVSVGVLAGGFTLFVPLSVWQRQDALLLMFGILLLALVLVPGIGREVNGSTRWIGFGPASFQPSELMKLFVTVYLAGYLVRRGPQVRSLLVGFSKPVAVLMVIAALLLLEPDYGTTVVVFATALGMLFVGGVPLWRFSFWMLSIGSALAVTILMAPYRLTRLTTFVDPWADPFGSGFQLTQALIAIGRGEWFGVGLGAGVQKLFYLPEAHTDFLFSVMAEELGLFGMCVVIYLFSVLVWRAFSIARQSELQNRWFAAYLAYGLGLLVGLQAFINIGVNMGLLPTKGLTLPLMSYGGTSVVVNCVIVALMLRMSREVRVPQ